MDAAASDRFAELLEAFEQSGEPPPGWVDRHAPNGDLRMTWEGCNDARVLLRWSARSGDRSSLVRAACACARTTMPLVPPGEFRPLRAIEAAEAWARGDAPLEAVFAAYVDLCSYVPGYGSLAASAASNLADIDACGDPTSVADLAAADFAALRDVPKTVTLEVLAAVVRAHIPCPTLDELHAAHRRG